MKSESRPVAIATGSERGSFADRRTLGVPDLSGGDAALDLSSKAPSPSRPDEALLGAVQISQDYFVNMQGSALFSNTEKFEPTAIG